MNICLCGHTKGLWKTNVTSGLIFTYLFTYLFVWCPGLAIKPKALYMLYTCLAMELLYFWRRINVFAHSFSLNTSQKTNRYPTRHGVCGLRKGRCVTLLCQLPFLASQIGRTLNSVKYKLCQASQKLCAKPTYGSAWASQLLITRDSGGAPFQPQVGNAGQKPSANASSARQCSGIFKRHDVSPCLSSRGKLKILEQLS